MGIPTSRPAPDFLSGALPETGAAAVQAAVVPAAPNVGVAAAGVGRQHAIRGRGCHPGVVASAVAHDADPNPTALELADALRGALDHPHGQ